MGDNNLDLEAEDAQLRSLDLRRFGFQVAAPQQGRVGADAYSTQADISIRINAPDSEHQLLVQLKACQLWNLNSATKATTFKRSDNRPMKDYFVDYLLLSIEDTPGAWEHYVIDMLKVGGDWAEQFWPGQAPVDPNLAKLLGKSSIQRVPHRFRALFQDWKVDDPGQLFFDEIRRRDSLGV